jgi:hypothetical protein
MPSSIEAALKSAFSRPASKTASGFQAADVVDGCLEPKAKGKGSGAFGEPTRQLP